MASPFGPLESQIERLGDVLINKVSEEVFGDGEAARLTRVVIYNDTDQDLYYLDSTFESGGFSTNMQPTILGSRTVGGYRVESHGIATGVTAPPCALGTSPGDEASVLDITTSNPYAGDNTGTATTGDGLTARSSVSVGNANEFEVDLFTN